MFDEYGGSRFVMDQVFSPCYDPVIADRAEAVAELSALLLMATGAPLLCVAGRPAECRPVVTFWNDVYEIQQPDPHMIRTLRLFRPIMTATERAATSLRDALRPNWVHLAPVGSVGFVTDGIGVAFSPDDPCPLASGWMSRQVNRASGLTQLRPFEVRSAWSLLITPMLSGVVH